MEGDHDGPSGEGAAVEQRGQAGGVGGGGTRGPKTVVSGMDRWCGELRSAGGALPGLRRTKLLGICAPCYAIDLNKQVV